MNTLIIAGLAVGAGVTVTDRFIRKLPNWLATVLYAVAAGLIIAGAVVTRGSGV